MKNLKRVKDEIKFKLIFKRLKVEPCWKCKHFKFNKNITYLNNVFVCNSRKDMCKKWKEKGTSILIQKGWDREDIIEDVLDKYKILKKRKKEYGEWRMK